jgi:hypothetical protein
LPAIVAPLYGMVAPANRGRERKLAWLAPRRS